MDIPLTIVGVQRICLPVCVVVVTEGIRVAVSKAPPWSHEDTAGSVLNVVCIVTVGCGTNLRVDEAFFIPVMQSGKGFFHLICCSSPIQLAGIVFQEVSRCCVECLIYSIETVSIVGGVQEVGVGSSAVVDTCNRVIRAETCIFKFLSYFAKFVNCLRNFQS